MLRRNRLRALGVVLKFRWHAVAEQRKRASNYVGLPRIPTFVVREPGTSRAYDDARSLLVTIRCEQSNLSFAWIRANVSYRHLS
jgi:hypothetical protein